MNKSKNESKTNLPGEENSHLKECVFGPEIKNPCPIRTILESTQTEKATEDGKEVLAKALGTQTPPQIQALFNPLQDLFKTMNEDKHLATLANFCRCCPFIQKYTWAMP